MKNTYFITIIAAVLSVALTGCQEKMGGMDENQFTVSIDNGDTKTALGDNDRVCWSDGDKIFVNGTDADHTLTVLPFGKNATSAAVSGSVAANSSGRRYCGYYPAGTAYWTVSSSARQVKLPATPTYNFMNPLGNVPMYAESDDEHLVFRSVFGLLEFSITGYQSVTSVKLSCTAGNLAGTFNIDGTGKAVISGTGTQTVTMSFPIGGAKLDYERGLKIYFAIAEGTYTNLRLDVYTDAGGEINSTVSSLKVTRGGVYPFAFEAEPKAVQLWEGGPYWATTNMGATTEYGRGDYYTFGALTKTYSSISGTTVTYLPTNPDNSRFLIWSNAASDNWSRTTFNNNGTSPAFTKYNAVDRLTELLDEDDVAYALWGPKWQIPSKQDVNDLVANTSATRVTISGARGWKFASKTDPSKYIFILEAGVLHSGSISGWMYAATRTLTGINSQNYYVFWASTSVSRDNYNPRFRNNQIRPIRHK